MRGIMSVVLVNVTRSLGRPWYVIMTVALMLAAILAAVLVGTRIDSKPTIAYVVDPTAVTLGDANGDSIVPAISLAEVSSPTDVEAIVQHAFRVERLEQVPPMSQLMRNRYDAVVVDYGNGQAGIVTIKNEAFRVQLEHVLSTPDALAHNPDTQWGVGTTIIGYVIMFVLMSGSAFMNFFTDDKQSGTFRRTVTSPVGIRAYLAGQLLFNALMLFVPTAGVLVVLKELFRVDIGFTYGQYVLLLGLISGLSTAFGFFMASVMENPDDGMAVAASIILVTSLLGGTFFIFNHDGAVMDVVISLLPQRSLMKIAHGLEQGGLLQQFIGPMGHVAAVALGLCLAGWVVCQARFSDGRY